MGVPRGPRGPGPVPVLQGLRQRLSHRRGHGHLQVRDPAPDLPGQSAATGPLHPGPTAVLAAARRTDGSAGQRRRPGAGAAPGDDDTDGGGHPALVAAAAAGAVPVVSGGDTGAVRLRPSSGGAVGGLLLGRSLPGDPRRCPDGAGRRRV
ncbi:hypothetical protein ACFFX0_16080 [Citricoccus parietis]|uniref:Uncharacterized protein n=1 Tax=Citricoccus parietis TaxID=592307 RepID=A0ABV5G120_9MICC